MTLPDSVATLLRDRALAPRPNPFGVHVEVPGAQAFALWQTLAGACRGSGVWPVIVGEARNLGELASMREVTDTGDPAATLAYAERIDLKAALLGGEEPPEPEDFEGDWPDAGDLERHVEPQAVRRTDGAGYLDRVAIAIVPAAEPWQAPAYLSFGGFNECAEPAAHVAQHRLWAQRYGSEICSITSDSVECVVARPPTTRDAALALAIEQFGYNLDLVAQTMGSIERLAATLQGAPLWYFWWD